MANLHALFIENGLQGIVPYAFGMRGQGYQFLCQKLMEGVPFWIITASDTKMPFVFAEGDRVMFGLYSTEEQAVAKCDELAMDNFLATAVKLEPEGWAAELLRRYRDLGATHLFLDNAIWVKMSDIAPVATYEGILNVHTPLRNSHLNAALYFLAQYSAAGIEHGPVIAYFWNLLKASRLYAPMRQTKKLQPGESLTRDNSDYHYIVLGNNTRAVLCFTDSDFVKIYAEMNELPTEEYSVASTPGYLDWKAFLDQNPSMNMVLNFGAGDFFFSQEDIRRYELVALNQAATDAGDSCPIL